MLMKNNLLKRRSTGVKKNLSDKNGVKNTFKFLFVFKRLVTKNYI